MSITLISRVPYFFGVPSPLHLPLKFSYIRGQSQIRILGSENLPLEFIHVKLVKGDEDCVRSGSGSWSRLLILYLYPLPSLLRLL